MTSPSDFIPSTSKLDVFIREGPAPRFPAHAFPCVIPSVADPVHYVGNFQRLPDDRRGRCMPLRAVLQAEMGINGRPIVLFDRSQIPSSSAGLVYDYSVIAAEEHAYWFRVYHNAGSNADVQARRLSRDKDTRDLAETELSVTELSIMATVIIDLEMIQNHKAQETLGCVIDCHLTNGGRTLYALVRPYNTEAGRLFCKNIEFGLIVGCSLGHARSGSKVQLHEISLCPLGARHGTVFVNAVFVADEPRPAKHPRMYEQPVFSIAASAPPDWKTGVGVGGGAVCIPSLTVMLPRSHRRHVARLPYEDMYTRGPHVAAKSWRDDPELLRNVSRFVSKNGW